MVASNPQCESLFANNQLNFQPECLSFYVSKALSTAILVGSFALKLPQILNIISTKSVEGLSPASFYLEVPLNLSTIIYNYLQNNPFSSYGEMAIICVQNVILVALLWVYAKERPSASHMVSIVALFVGTALVCFNTPAELQYVIPLLQLPMVIVSRIPQIVTNLRAKSTGQLSFFTSFLQFGGSLARIFTTIQEVGWDFSLLFGFLLSGFLSAVLVAQIVLYPVLYGQKDKKKEKKSE